MKLKGVLIAAISAILFGSSGLIQKPLYADNVYPLNVLTVAYFIGSIVLFTYLFFFKGKKFLIVPKESIKHIIIHSLFGMVAVTVSFSFSIKLLDVSISTMLLYTYPVIVSVYSVLVLKENVSFTKILCIIGTLLGSMLVLNIFNINNNFPKIGIIIGVFSAFAYAFLNLYGDKLLKYNLNPLTIVFYNVCITFLTLIIINHKLLFNLNVLNAKIVISAGLLSVVCQIIPMFLLYVAIRLIGPVLTSIITPIEIPAAALLSFIFLGENISLIQWIGIIIVLLCILLIKMEKPNLNTKKC